MAAVLGTSQMSRDGSSPRIHIAGLMKQKSSRSKKKEKTEEKLQPRVSTSLLMHK